MSYADFFFFSRILSVKTQVDLNRSLIISFVFSIYISTEVSGKSAQLPEKSSKFYLQNEPQHSKSAFCSGMCAQRRFRSACASAHFVSNFTGRILQCEGCKVFHAVNEDSAPADLSHRLLKT